MHALLLAAAAFAQDCQPPLTDLARFPPQELCWGQVRFADRHLAWLEDRGRLGLMTGEELVAVKEDALWCRRCWDELDSAGRAFYPEESRRAALGRLRRLLGDGAYLAGRMPPPVPLWRFGRAD